MRNRRLQDAIRRNKNAIRTASDIIFNDMATSAIEGNHRLWRNPGAQWGPSTSYDASRQRSGKSRDWVGRSHYALRIVARGIGKYAGKASLRFENGLLSVEAHGTVASAPASGAWPVPIFVPASWVQRLARRMPLGDPLSLRIKEDRIYLERYSQPCALTPTIIPAHADLPQIDETGLIEEAAKVLKPLLIKRSDLEELVAEARAKGAAPWSTDEKRMTSIIAKAWALLAPLGVETTDIRRLVDKAVRNAWK